MQKDRSQFAGRLPVMMAGVLPLVFLLAACGGTESGGVAPESSALSVRDAPRVAAKWRLGDETRERDTRPSASGWNDHRGHHSGSGGGHEQGGDDGDDGDDGEHDGDDDGTSTPPPTTPDAGTASDAGQPPPTTTPDAGQPPPPPATDAGTTATPDAGTTATPDAGTTATPDAGTTATPDAGTTACIDPVTAGSGHHNAGADCLSCHAGMSNANWTIAGTLYSAASGGTAVSGATIEIVDARGAVLRLPTATNGNFYTTQPVSFPVHVRASKCPSDAVMSGPAASGSCNSCHNASFRVHLP